MFWRLLLASEMYKYGFSLDVLVCGSPRLYYLLYLITRGPEMANEAQAARFTENREIGGRK